ncbi:acyloxyacyl hydrolase [Phragmitibacter flavus]|uniref:Acyloxyacyl hydrolase n=1 Tax=Phragmitibacter flavus TaxID=2576071 RepID=A0A5R8KGR6_9BACT|nr:acyloxyacyl hydrolase [Phragmitibacter flavus]TLD71503.1 acyloxyacyl hydrolase [Phragmitibacter flavus]
MWRSLLAAVLLSSTSSLATAGETSAPPAPAYDPLDHWEFAYETGALWSFGSNATPLDYVLLPQLLTFKSPYVFKGEFLGGTLALRNRLTIAVEPIVEGPENYFIGFTGAGLLEWWNPARNFSMFFTAGGGLGLMDSKGYEVEGGQGQDLNYTWLVYSGVRVMPAERVSVSLGLYFQHISNMDQDDINPGIDALGPMFSVGWHF